MSGELTGDELREIARSYRFNAVWYARAGDLETAAFWDSLSDRYEKLARERDAA